MIGYHQLPESELVVSRSPLLMQQDYFIPINFTAESANFAIIQQIFQCRNALITFKCWYLSYQILYQNVICRLELFTSILLIAFNHPSIIKNWQFYNILLILRIF